MTIPRKILSFVAATALAATLSACSEEKDRETPTDELETSETVTEPTETTSEPTESTSEPVEATSEPDGTVETSESAVEPTDTPNDDDSSADALEQFVENERIASEQYAAQNQDMYSDVAVDPLELGEYSGLTYSYTYVQEVDAVEAASLLEGQADALLTDLSSAAFPAMEAAGIDGPLVAQVVYQNPDSSLIWSFSALQDDTGAMCSVSGELPTTFPATCAEVG